MKDKTDVEELAKYIADCMDAIGLELKVWNSDFFGRKAERDCIQRLAQALITEGYTRTPSKEGP